MIKTAVRLSHSVTPELIRLLKKHPDVDLTVIARGNDPYLRDIIQELQGEFSDTPIEEALPAEADLYIGEDFAALPDFLAANPEAKAVVIGRCESLGEDVAPELVPVVGVCEYNRKALVRGARVAFTPDTPTLLAALALMPLAKNLMLGTPVAGSMIIPDHTIYPTAYQIAAQPISPESFEILRSLILSRLQTSFNSPLEFCPIHTSHSHFAFVSLTVDIRLSLEQAYEIYRGFYGDHRHIFFPEDKITDRMVLGTNKTVITLANDRSGRLLVNTAFDSRYKSSAGNIVHLLNLLFGLDERTGF